MSSRQTSNEPKLNPLFKDLLDHYSVTALPCRVADPDRKGKVESGVGHAQKTPLKGKRFESLEEAQTYLDNWELLACSSDVRLDISPSSFPSRRPSHLSCTPDRDHCVATSIDRAASNPETPASKTLPAFPNAARKSLEKRQ